VPFGPAFLGGGEIVRNGLKRSLLCLPFIPPFEFRDQLGSEANRLGQPQDKPTLLGLTEIGYRCLCSFGRVI
jgi:hypothetical protein